MSHKNRNLIATKPKAKKKSFNVEIPEALYMWIQVMSMRLQVTPSDIFACSLFAAATPIAPTIFADYIRATSRARIASIEREEVGANLSVLRKYDIASCHLYNISLEDAKKNWESAYKLKRSYRLINKKDDNTQT